MTGQVEISPNSTVPVGERLEELIERTLQLPTMPAVARKLMEALEDPEVSAVELARIITVDQGITARVMKICNSSFYGLHRPVDNVRQAVMVLGFVELRQLVVSASTRYVYKRFGPRERALWQHSVGTAIAAHMLSLAFASHCREVAFQAGQMHDLGRVLINNSLPEEYDALLLRSGEETPGLSMEREVFGFTHVDVGGLILKSWRMSEAVYASAALHHSPDVAYGELDEIVAGTLACVTLGNALCRFAGVGMERRAETLVLDEPAVAAMRYLGASEGQLQDLATEFIERFEAEASVFDD